MKQTLQKPCYVEMCLDLKEIDSNYLNNVMILDEEF